MKVTEAPERIYGWMDSQLSIARFYGSCTFNGARYVISENEDGKPLVRADLLAREMKEAKDLARAERRKAEHDAAMRQDAFGGI